MLNPSARDDSASANAAVRPWDEHASRVLALVSQKGGVGKTTSTVNLGACFALNGHRVLVIGTDPQCGLSRSLGLGPQQLRGGLREVLLSGLPLADVAHATVLPGLQVVSSDAWTMSEEEQYKDLMARQARAFVAAVNDARASFDTILIDCPPGFGAETRAALLAADGFLVPVQAEELSRDSLARLLDHVREFGAASADAAALDGLFLTMTDHRTRMSRRVATLLGEEYGDRLLETTIPRNTRLSEMAVDGRPTVIFDRRSSGSRAYFDLMDEILVRRGRTAAATAPHPAPRIVAAAPEPRATEPPRPPALQSAAGGADRPRSPGRLLDDLRRNEGAGGFAGLLDREDEVLEASTDLLSLDDLLEEEEHGARDRRDEGDWGYGDDYYETVN
ncbi:MAG: ParA family protein [Candidatus Latescibacteria bacterium]|nr:ParA family protein [Candidatus Latescibacterota bacterium]